MFGVCDGSDQTHELSPQEQSPILPPPTTPETLSAVSFSGWLELFLGRVRPGFSRTAAVSKPHSEQGVLAISYPQVTPKPRCRGVSWSQVQMCSGTKRIVYQAAVHHKILAMRPDCRKATGNSAQVNLWIPNALPSFR